MTHVLLSQKVEDNATRDKDAVVALLGIRSDIEQYITDIHNARSEDAHSLGRHTDGNGLDNAGAGASPTTMKSSKPSADQVVSGDHERSTSSDSEELSDARDASQLAQNSSRVGGGHTARLREARILLHKVQFLLGDAYHRLGCTADEDSSYSAAEHIRKQLLRHTEQRALQTMQTLHDRKKRDLGIREQFNILPAENPGKQTAQLVCVPHIGTGCTLKYKFHSSKKPTT
jgi:E3 ubiquitin-protein ligase SHPRH